MTKIISGLIFLPTLLLAQSATPTPEPENTVRVEEEVAPVLTGEDLYRSLIHTYANYYDVSETDMVRVVECESGWVPDVQSGILYTQGQIDRNPYWGEVGEREKSFGLAQIHLPAGHTWKGKLVTKEMANTPEIAIEFMAYSFSIGKKSMWSCL